MISDRVALAAALALLATPPAAHSAESCDQIRTEIRGKTGIQEQADTVLLKKISARTDCLFSAAEVFRAAYGDRPIPQETRRERHASSEEDDDD